RLQDCPFFRQVRKAAFLQPISSRNEIGPQGSKGLMGSRSPLVNRKGMGVMAQVVISAAGEGSKEEQRTSFTNSRLSPAWSGKGLAPLESASEPSSACTINRWLACVTSNLACALLGVTVSQRSCTA